MPHTGSFFIISTLLSPCPADGPAQPYRQLSVRSTGLAPMARPPSSHGRIPRHLFLEGLDPFIRAFLRFLASDAVAFLKSADKLVLLPSDEIEVVVGEFAPFLFRRTFELLPFSFYLVPIHECYSFVYVQAPATTGTRKIPGRSRYETSP